MRVVPRFVLWLFLAGTFFSGCRRPPDGKTEILFSFWGTVQTQKVETQIAREFEKENPDIRVRLLPIGLRYEEKIQAMMVGDVAPDVIMVEIATYDEWASRGVLMDLTALVDELSVEGKLMPVPRKAYERDGRYYGVPLNVHGLVLYCNLDALRAAGIPFSPHGWTWDQIREMAPRLSRRKGDPQALTDYAILTGLGLVPIMLASYGVTLFDNPQHPQRVTVNTPAAHAALDLYVDLNKKGYAVPHDILTDQGTYQLFREGRVALYFSGRWATPEIVGKTGFDWDVVPVPSGPAGSVTMHGGAAAAVWAKSPHPEAAKRFVKFYAGRKGARIAMQGGRSVPVFEDLAYSPEFLNLHPPASIVRFPDTMQEGAAILPLYAPGYAEVRRLLLRRSEQLVYRNAPVKEVLPGLQEDLEEWLARHARKGSQ